MLDTALMACKDTVICKVVIVTDAESDECTCTCSLRRESLRCLRHRHAQERQTVPSTALRGAPFLSNHSLAGPSQSCGMAWQLPELSQAWRAPGICAAEQLLLPSVQYLRIGQRQPAPVHSALLATAVEPVPANLMILSEQRYMWVLVTHIEIWVSGTPVVLRGARWPFGWQTS